MENSYDCDFSGLDEYLTEYIDGTMDPSVRAVFEELIDKDPDLAEYVCRLRHTRGQLFQLACCCSAPSGFQVRLQRRISCEIARKQAFSLQMSPVQSAGVALLCSAVLIVVVSLTVYPDQLPRPGEPAAQAPGEISGMSLAAGTASAGKPEHEVPFMNALTGGLLVPHALLNSSPPFASPEYIRRDVLPFRGTSHDTLGFRRPLSFAPLSIP